MKHATSHLIAVITMAAVSAYAANDGTLYYELPSSTDQQITVSPAMGEGSKSKNEYCCAN